MLYSFFPLFFLLSLLFSFSLLASSFFITAELLDWKARENGLSLAIKSKGDPTFVDEGSVKDIDFQYNLGARLGIGGFFKQHWEFLLQGTHFHNYTSTKSHASGASLLLPIWINAAATGSGSIEKAYARWRLHFGMIDLDFARMIRLGKRLHLKPYVGLRYVIVRQKYEILYSGGTLFPKGQDSVHMKNKFAGLGPLAGIKAVWDFWKILSLYASVDLALPYGHFYIHQSEYASVGTKRRLRLFHEFNLIRAIADFALGITYSYRWASLNIGWEEHLLFGQNQLLQFVDSNVPAAHVSNQGDLTLSGLVAGLTVTF